MKLKKIASLALAGVMAVSMLAGCAGKTNTDTNTNEKPATGTNVAAVLNANETTDFDIVYTDDATLSSKMQQVLDLYGTGAFDNTGLKTEVKGAIASVAGLENEAPKVPSSYLTWTSLVNANVNYYGNHSNNGKDGDLVGTYTVYDFYVMKGFNTKEAAIKAYANTMDSAIKAGTNLSDKSYNYKAATSGQKYYEYSYNGTVGMATVKNADGTMTYVFAYAVNQVVSEKTV